MSSSEANDGSRDVLRQKYEARHELDRALAVGYEFIFFALFQVLTQDGESLLAMHLSEIIAREHVFFESQQLINSEFLSKLRDLQAELVRWGSRADALRGKRGFEETVADHNDEVLKILGEWEERYLELHWLLNFNAARVMAILHDVGELLNGDIAASDRVEYGDGARETTEALVVAYLLGIDQHRSSLSEESIKELVTLFKQLPQIIREDLSPNLDPSAKLGISPARVAEYRRLLLYLYKAFENYVLDDWSNYLRAEAVLVKLADRVQGAMNAMEYLYNIEVSENQIVQEKEEMVAYILEVAERSPQATREIILGIKARHPEQILQENTNLAWQDGANAEGTTQLKELLEETDLRTLHTIFAHVSVRFLSMGRVLGPMAGLLSIVGLDPDHMVDYIDPPETRFTCSFSEDDHPLQIPVLLLCRDLFAQVYGSRGFGWLAHIRQDDRGLSDE